MVLEPIQQLLDYITSLKPILQANNYQFNQTNVREALFNLGNKYVSELDTSIMAIDEVIMHQGYPIPIRIYLPTMNQTPCNVAINIHGGGHIAGSIHAYDKVFRKYAKYTQCIMVAIDYRLSPEFAYPVGINDCKTVIENIFPVLDKRHIKYTNQSLRLIGDSSGAAICATIIQDTDLVKRCMITAQALIYPSLDYTLSSQSVEKYKVGYLLEADKVHWYFSNYFQHNEDRKLASPLFAASHQTSVASLIITPEYDMLHGEAVAYYDKLIKASSNATLLTIKGVTHAFLHLHDLCPAECHQTYTAIADFVNKY